MERRMLILMLLIAVMICTVKGETFVAGGNVDTTWYKASSPYVIQGDITVLWGDTLIIEPGVVVDFDGYYSITVKGNLFAQGVPGDSIYFTRVIGLTMNPDTVGLADTSNTNGSWAGIEFDMASMDSSSMSHCVVEYMSTVDNDEDSYSNLPSAVEIQSNSIVHITNSVFRNNLATNSTIYCRGQLSLEDCLIRYNTAFGSPVVGLDWSVGGVKIEYEDDCRIVGNTFMDNMNYGTCGSAAVSLNASRAIVMGNFISNNRSFKSGVSAGGILLRSSYPVIANNLIVNNRGNSAAAIYYQWSGGKLLNNTICNNKSDGSSHGALEIEGPTGMIGNNNLLYNNWGGTFLSQVYLGDMNSLPVFEKNLIGDDLSEIRGDDNGAIDSLENFFGDPAFLNATTTVGVGEYSSIEDWQLTESTSLINVGDKTFIKEYDIQTDIMGFKRLNYGDVDIGCIEYRQSSINPGSTISSPEIWIADTVYIDEDLTLDAKVTVFPGVVVCFTDTCSWLVKDSLYVLGNEDAPVLFTRDDTAGFQDLNSSAGGWGYIQLYGHDPKVFQYCIFQYGKYYNSADVRGVFTGFHNSQVTFDHCTFRYNRGLNCGILYTFSGSHFTLKSNTFHNNSGIGYAGLINLSGSNYDLDGNLILNNNCSNVLGISEANLRLVNNSIYHNNGGIYLEGSNIEAYNNTIYNNQYDPSFGDGDYQQVRNSVMGPGSVYFSGAGYEVSNTYMLNHNCEGCSDMITQEPVFVNALSYKGTGPDEEVFAADYSLSSISPGIDAGIADTAGLGLPAIDIAGNQRVWNDRVDIGAYENQYDVPLIIENPVGGAFCAGDNHELLVGYTRSDSALFQWFKDGQVIPAATNDTLAFDSLTIADEGNYFCRVMNSYGYDNSNPVFLKITSPPDILVQPEDSWREAGKQVNYQVVFGGSPPLAFQWSLDGEDIEGANLPEYKFIPYDSTQEGLYSCRISNACGTVEAEPFSMYLAPQLCMVTIDTTTGKNLIVWEKKTKAPIFAYKVMRESVAAGIYDELGTVPFDDLSVFEDSIADPTSQAYLYKIIAIDTADNETDVDLCKPHKTIHLLVSLNEEFQSAQLSWDNYYGFEYQTYVIFRSETGTGFQQVQEISASLNSWTDRDSTVTEDPFYRIAVLKPGSCYPEGLGGSKAGAGPYHHAMSNLDKSKFQASSSAPDSLWLDNLTVYENMMVGTMVGRLHTLDADSSDLFTYQLVSGDGDSNNTDFTVLADLLLTAKIFDHAVQDTASIRIQTKDGAGKTLDTTFVILVLQDATGIFESMDMGSVKVYPNPSSGMVTVESTSSPDQPYRLRLYDLTGKVLLDRSGIQENRYEFNCENLPPGVYYLELMGKELYRTKLIIGR